MGKKASAGVMANKMGIAIIPAFQSVDGVVVSIESWAYMSSPLVLTQTPSMHLFVTVV
jgi:hypothetical protein